VSFTIVKERNPEGNATEAPVHRLATILNMLGHDRVHLLKMDIEGSEYGVIDDLIDSAVKVDQLLVEFHHRFRGIGAARTAAAIHRLRGAGFKLFHISTTGEDYAFIRA
jgi:hypothetical protein